MVNNVAVIVLDGFGAGAMPDAGELRHSDLQANTALSLARWCDEVRGRPLAIPNLLSLGFGLVDTELAAYMGEPEAPFHQGILSVAHRVGLGYPGADTFAGHQTMMGADMSHAAIARVGQYEEALTELLESHGFAVKTLVDSQAQAQPLLVVDGAILVHDNLEADPGLNWNVSGRLSEVPFEKIVEVTRLVRTIAPVGRVIAVGGYSDEPLPHYVRPGSDGTVGLDTPASGFYRNGGLQVIHFGVEIDHARQLPQLAADNQIKVNLVGKAADILVTDSEVSRYPGVETDFILEQSAQCLGATDEELRSLSVINVQQTDLAGHQQDPARYAAVIEQFDSWLGTQLPLIKRSDCLLITADHGNDPLIGHSFHTREYVAALCVTAAGEQGPQTKLGEPFASLADLGASCAALLGIPDGKIGHGNRQQLFV